MPKERKEGTKIGTSGKTVLTLVVLRKEKNEFKRVISPFAKTCPKLGDKSICAMFNLVGRCHFGSRCYHSHEELPEDVGVAMERWVAECKKQAKEPTPKKNGGDNKKNKD
jgi:hypothetical protein